MASRYCCGHEGKGYRSDQRTEDEILADLAKTREEITATLGELVDQVDQRQAVKRSKQQAQQAAADLGETAKAKAEQLQEKALATVDEAKQGDQRARAIVAGVAVGALAVGVVVVRRLIR